MHIAFVCAEYPIFGRPTGGFGTYVQRLAKSLVQLGHPVTIICLGTEQQIISHGYLHVRIIVPAYQSFLNLLALGHRANLDRLAAFLRYPVFFSFAAARVLKQIDSVEPIHIIEGGDFGAELFFLLLTLKYRTSRVVIKLHTPSFLIRKYNQEKRTLFYLIIEWMEQYCLEKADGVYSPTKALAREVNHITSVHVEKIIPYPIFRKKSFHKTTVTFQRILYVGKLQTKKGIFTLLEAFAKVVQQFPRAKLLCIGPDTIENGKSVKSLLVKFVKENKLVHSIEFLLPVTQKQLLRFYRNAMLVVVPSIWENYPNVLLEAINSGTAVVASRVGGIVEIVKHKNHAYLTRPGKPKELAKSIIFLLANKRIRNRLSKNAFKALQFQLKPEKIAKKTIHYYEQILKK